MNRSLIVGTLILVLAPMVRAQPAQSGGAAELETQFRTLPMETRRWTGPLFWLHGDESRERLEMYIGKIAEGGNGTFTAESRPHNDWLGPNWYRDLDICLQAAKKNNLSMWIFDEKWWPSQGVAGRVPARYAAKQLVATAIDVDGPKAVQAEGYSGDTFVAAIAGRIVDGGAIDGASLVDLGPSIKDGKLDWQAPAGRWKVMKFTHKTAPGLGQGGTLSVDGMSRDCVDWFLQTVYQPHYDRFKDDFGKTIKGFFYDEPETRGDWGTELPRVLDELKIDWKKAYVAYKFQLAGDEQAAARYGYLDARAETWGRVMYGETTRWCKEHGVLSIGHFMEHGNLYLHPDFCAGDMMRVQKYSDMGAIDAVFSQFRMGQRSGGDPLCWQTPKLGSSISHAYGKTDDLAMIEIFGARGQDLTYSEMKWWLDHMQVSGINFIIPHSFNPRAPHDTDCPPYFYNGGHEPRWPLYRVFADYSTRLTHMLTGGRHVCPVALLSLGNAAQVGRHIKPEQMSEALQDALFDCDWLPFEVFENDAKLDGGRIALRTESYRILVVPPVEVIPYATLEKARAFFDQGGIVITHGFLPSRSATLGKSSSDIAALRTGIWGENPQVGLTACRTSAAGGRSYLLPDKPTAQQLQQVLTADAGVHPTVEVLAGRTDNWVHVLHRVKANRDIFFICNQNHQGEARTFKLRVTATGEPECWDPMRNQVLAVPFRRGNDHTLDIDLPLEPLESVLLVFNDRKVDRPARLLAGAVPARSLAIERLPNPPAPSAEATPAKSPLARCNWVWFPEGDPAAAAPPATRYFRRAIEIPADHRIAKATFTLTCDNAAKLFVNGKEAGASDSSENGWENPVALDVASKLVAGRNILAIAATNGGEKPNPAGLIGQLTIAFEGGQPIIVPINAQWKCANAEAPNWTDAGFDDSAWAAAKEIAGFGRGPWGSLDRARAGALTLSPIEADPFLGRVDLPADLSLSGVRAFVEMDQLPDTAAAIRVNGAPVGGVIGRPCRVEVTASLKAGENRIEILPLAPASARIVIYPK